LRSWIARCVLLLILAGFGCDESTGGGRSAADARKEAKRAADEMSATTRQRGIAFECIQARTFKGRWPKDFNDLLTLSTVPDRLREFAHNPVTGSDPGDEAVAPDPDVQPNDQATRRPIVFQVRGGRRRVDGPVVYTDGELGTLSVQEQARFTPGAARP
jgi:hypothetical protein